MFSSFAHLKYTGKDACVTELSVRSSVRLVAKKMLSLEKRQRFFSGSKISLSQLLTLTLLTGFVVARLTSTRPI